MPESASLEWALRDWVEHGWLRPIDRALVNFLAEQAPHCDERVLLTAALVSHQLGRGHICLDLEATLADPDDALSLPPEGDPNNDALSLPSERLRPLDPAAWARLLEDSAIVGTGEGTEPLVLDGGRLYLRRYWQYERQVARALRDRLGLALDTPDDLDQRLEQLFGPLRDTAEADRSAIHWQTVAAALAARQALTIISGGPGTGKTTTVVRLLGLLQGLALDRQKPLRIHLAAPTGKAAARLTESIGAAVDQLPEAVRAHIPATVTTLHRLLRPLPNSRKFRHHAGDPLHLDLLVVDEASMVDLELMAALLDALSPRTRLILLGDKDQLASVEAGAVLGELCLNADRPGYSDDLVRWLAQRTGYDLKPHAGEQGAIAHHIALLRKSHRFHAASGIGRIAEAVNRQDSDGALALLRGGQYDDLAWIHPPQADTLDDDLLAGLAIDGGGDHFPAVPASDGPLGYRDYLQRIRRGPGLDQSFDDWAREVLAAFGQFQVITALRQGPYGVDGLNGQLEKLLRRRGLIAGDGPWYPGRPVLITRNDYSLGLMNGDIGIALPDASAQARLRVCFLLPDGGVKRVLPSRLGAVETVYAMTVHKSQGSEFTHTCLILPDRTSPILTKELVYTGITRARRWLSLVTPRTAVLSGAIRKRTQRASGLAEALLEREPIQLKLTL